MLPPGSTNGKMDKEELQIFDSHCHVLVPPTAHKQAINSNGRGTDDSEASLGKLLGEWRNCGISSGMLTQPSFYRSDNSVLLKALLSDSLIKTSRNFGLVGVVAFDWDVVSLRDLQCWADDGVVGVRLNYFRGKPEDMPDLLSDSAVKVLTWIRHLNWHINVYADACDIPTVLVQLMKFHVKIVINHFGMPHFETEANRNGFAKILEIAREVPDYPLFVTLSGDFRFSNDPKFVAARAQELLAAFGELRVLWASDFPFTRYAKLGLSVQLQYRKLLAWVPSMGVREKILRSNPHRVFFSGRKNKL